MVVAAVIVSIVIAIPVVIMVEAPATAIPITGIVPVAIVMRPNPSSPDVRRPRPVSGVPPVATAFRVPVAVNPTVFRTRSNGADCDDARRGWRADANAETNLTE